MHARRDCRVSPRGYGEATMREASPLSCSRLRSAATWYAAWRRAGASCHEALPQRQRRQPAVHAARTATLPYAMRRCRHSCVQCYAASTRHAPTFIRSALFMPRTAAFSSPDACSLRLARHVVNVVVLCGASPSVQEVVSPAHAGGACMWRGRCGRHA